MAIRDFLDKNIAKPHIVNLVIFLTFFLVSWASVGTLFGQRGVPDGDDWFIVANSSLGQFPLCTGSANFVNPWRPFHPTIHCLVINLVGPNLPILFALNALLFAATAFAWYGIVRNVFAPARWFAFAMGLIYLTYPDFLGRLRLTTGISLAGTMFILYGIWFVLSCWDRPGQRWRLAAGCLLTVYGLLAYEASLAVWAVGLPLALLYKSRRLSRRWVWTTVIVELTIVVYLLWRYFILPTTYNERTVISEHRVQIDPVASLGQIRDSFLLIGHAWLRNLQWLGTQIAATDRTTAIAVIAISLGIGLAILAALIAVYRADRTSPQASPQPARTFLISMVLIILLMGLPFYIVTIDFLYNDDHTFGTPFAASLGITGLLWIVLRKRLLVVTTSVLIVGMVVFNGIYSGYSVQERQIQTRYGCDFFVRFTDVVESLPPNVFVIVTAPRDNVLPDYFSDGYRFAIMHGLFYYDGPHDPARYDVKKFGYMGFLVFADSWAELTNDGIQVFWPERVEYYFHSESPLPERAPLDQTIFVRYAPLRELTILSAPEGLPGLVIRPEGGAKSQASALARRFCEWDPAMRETMRQLDAASQNQPTAAAWCRKEGVTVYQVNGNDRSTLFALSKEDLDKLPSKPSENMLIAQSGNVRLYRLTTGELQLNAPYSASQQSEYVHIWDGCSR